MINSKPAGSQIMTPGIHMNIQQTEYFEPPTRVNQQWESSMSPTSENNQQEYYTLTTSEKQQPQPLPPEFPRDPHTLICYVDGSYNHAIPKYAFGCVFLLPDGQILTESGNGNQPASLALRNVTGEMLGAMFAVRFAMKNAFTHIDIRYDYEGIEKWVTGAWKSKTDLTQKYAHAMRSWGTQIRITFQKVTAHSKVYYNDMADKLAKEALLGPNGIPELRTIEQMQSTNRTQL